MPKVIPHNLYRISVATNQVKEKMTWSRSKLPYKPLRPNQRQRVTTTRFPWNLMIESMGKVLEASQGWYAITFGIPGVSRHPIP